MASIVKPVVKLSVMEPEMLEFTLRKASNAIHTSSNDQVR